jgi:hypothetical protein
MEFVDDTYFDETVATAQGPVRIFPETHIFGTHLVLDEFLFFPLAQREPLSIGTAQVLAINRSLRGAAAAAGFTELTVVYHRIGSGRRGNTISHTRRLP